MSKPCKLTKRLVETIKPPPTEKFVWDAELKGFGIRIAAHTGVKTFILQYRHGTKQRRLKFGRFPTLTVEKARDRAIRGLANIADGRDPALERDEARAAKKVATLCDEYLAAARSGLVLGRGGASKKLSTIVTDAGRIERHIKPLLGNLPARDVTSSDISRFVAAVAQGKTAADVKTGFRGRAIVKGGKGAATRTAGLLGSIFEWARTQGYIQNNPVRGVRRFADGRREILYGDEQLALLGAVLRTLELDVEKRGRLNKIGGQIIRLIALTGLRREEARNLRWDEVDLEGRCLRLKSSKSVKVRPLGRSACELLASLLRSGDYVFSAQPGGKPYAALPRWWERLKREAAILSPDNPTALSDMTNHGFRHTMAGTADRLGYTEATVKAMIGHKGGGGVTAGYIHKPLDDVLLAAMDRVTDHIAAAMQGPTPTLRTP